MGGARERERPKGRAGRHLRAAAGAVKASFSPKLLPWMDDSSERMSLLSPSSSAALASSSTPPGAGPAPGPVPAPDPCPAPGPYPCPWWPPLPVAACADRAVRDDGGPSPTPPAPAAGAGAGASMDNASRACPTSSPTAPLAVLEEEGSACTASRFFAKKCAYCSLMRAFSFSSLVAAWGSEGAGGCVWKGTGDT